MDRIKNAKLKERIVSAEAAAALIAPGSTVGVSGFTSAGYPKLVPGALAKRAEAGEDLRLTVISGASVGDELDGVLARSGAVARRYPYQSNKDLRAAINDGRIAYADIHLGQLPYLVRSGVLGPVDTAVIEASAILEDGSIVPTMCVGSSDTFVQCARQVIVELNTAVPDLTGLHDIYTPALPPDTQPIPLVRPSDRIGQTAIPCDPEKICAIVLSDTPDVGGPGTAPDEVTTQIAKNLVAFLQNEQKAGRLADPLPPLQSGVGATGNAILSVLAESGMRGMDLYSEVLQSAVLDMIDSGTVAFASGCALSFTPAYQKKFYDGFETYREKIVLRPQEISNSAEVIRRLGVIAINTAIEADLSGNVNSTHIDGCRLMNGIGGSGDYARNAGLTVFVTPATAKDGALSCIVPYVSHVDHTEHDTDVIITEYGAADLRGRTAYERAELLIETCAAPAFRPQLREYMERVKKECRWHHGIPVLK
ncbi:MAG: acetyl-CoA hydrolase [Firmicutes bacterium]|nr:acetyl-CoA hydrolase [Bacillota bacterium]